MIRIKIAVSLVLSLCIASVQACEPGAIGDLPNFWKNFRHSSLYENQAQISKYYILPIKIAGIYQDDKEIKIGREIFLREYDAIFRKGLVGEEKTYLLKNLQAMPEDYLSNRIGAAIIRNKTKCLARIEDYELIWNGEAGWKINRVFYGEDFEILTGHLKEIKK